MSNYTKTTDFGAKDSLPTGDSGKIIRGTEFETEFDAISTAIATKADIAGPTFTGTLTYETISDGTISITAFVDEDDMSSNSANLVPTQQSVKAYVDAVTTELQAQDLDFQADTGGALNIDLDTETMTFTGGTGIDTSGSGNAVTFAIDSTVATLTGTQTLTNKTLTSPDVNTPDIDGGTIDGTVIGGTTPAAVSATTVSATGNITVGGTVDGRDVATDGTKLDGIEAGATADQTAAEIRTLVEAATDSNVFTDADHSKLDGIEAGATGDQTNAEIRAAVEAATDSNVFTDADHSKLDGIEALADVTDTTNVTAAGALMDSELTNITAVKALDQGVATTDTPTFAGLATSANVTFGDNDKAIFGAGSDLEIYHSGSHSFISEAGTGDLYIGASSNIALMNSAFSENKLLATTDGALKLYYDGSQKLSTTSTGIDVTGTATMDGLVSAGTAFVNLTARPTGVPATAGALWSAQTETGNYGIVARASSTDSFTYIGNTGSSATLGTSYGSSGSYLPLDLQTSDKKRLRIAANGDISFYEDTGTTAKLFWDASTERLGIGATSLTHALHVTGSSNEMGLFKRSAAGNSEVKIDTTTSGDAKLTFANDGTAAFTMGRDNSDSSFRIASGGTLGSNDRLVINSSGNVGIATSSPSNTLSVSGNMDITGTIALENSTGYGLRDNRNNLFLTTSADTAASNRTLTFGNATYGQTILDGGNVGIGTSSPETNLHIEDSSSFSIIRLVASTTENAGIDFGDPDDRDIGRVRYNNSDNSMVFHTNAAEQMRIDASGNVGIGTSSPNDKVDISGSTGDGYRLTDGTHTGVYRSISGGTILKTTSNHALLFGTNDTERMRIDSEGVAHFNGDVKVLSGDIQMGNTRGINFGPHANASGMTSETLDDYEEGTFTPTITSGTVTYTAQRGRYTKIGRVVYIHAFVQIASISGSSGTAIISGLPFVAKNDSNYSALASKTNGFNWGGSATMITFQVTPNTAVIGAVGSGNNIAFNDVNSSGLAANDWIACTGHYVTDS